MNNMKQEMEASYPIPDTPHTSIKMSAADQRKAFQVGWQAALASQASKGAGVPDYAHRAVTDMQSAAMRLAADLCQMEVETFKGLDYLQREPVMERVVQWRKERDKIMSVWTDESRAAPSPTQARPSVEDKALFWLDCLSKCAKILGLSDDTPIPSGVVAAVEKLIEAQAQPVASKDLIVALSAYLVREMPAGTVIGDPVWWAERIAKVVSGVQPPADAVPVEAKPLAEEWSYSTNGEDYKEQEGSRLEILAHALNELGHDYEGQIWIGRNVNFTGSGKSMTETVIEGLQEQAYEECGEYAETYLDDVTADEEKELADFITEWAKRVDRSNFWTVTDVETHTAESAIRALAAKPAE